MDSGVDRFSTRSISFEGAMMKLPNIDMHRPLPLWIPIAMITFLVTLWDGLPHMEYLPCALILAAV